jgi:thiol-disulfide isomerase/thioredoxin
MIKGEGERVKRAPFRTGAIGTVLTLLFLTSTALAGSGVEGAYIRPVGGVGPGDPVPSFHAKGLYGEDLDLGNLLKYEKKVVLAFWSMYCQACVEKFDAMIAIQNKYEYSGLVVISINTDGEYRKGEQVIRDFIGAYEKQHGVKVNFPVLYDETNWLALAMNVNFLPTIITVNSEGKVHNIYRRFGEGSKEEILTGIEDIVLDLIAVTSKPGLGGKSEP